MEPLAAGHDAEGNVAGVEIGRVVPDCMTVTGAPPVGGALVARIVAEAVPLDRHKFSALNSRACINKN